LNAVEIAAFAGPIALGSGPVRVTLTDSEALGRHGLAAHVTSLAPGRHIYLVLRELHAEEQPGVLFHVYLDLAEGAKPGKNDAHHVGALNFFGATQLRDAEKANAGERAFRSYDITALARKLQAQKLLSEQTTVTILPGAAPAANAHAQIGRIEVVEQ
jgi:tyrosinase